MRTLTRFIAGCIRSCSRADDSCKFPLTPEQTELATQLLSYLQNVHAPLRPADVPDDLVQGLQSLLFACVTRRRITAGDEQFHCPVQCFIASYSYNDDDTFKRPHSMTTLLANWQFLLRATALYEAKAAVSSGRSETMVVYGSLIAPIFELS
jgi:hypothetical protein